MRRMSFIYTQQQVRDRTKTVTRRLGWKTLQPGTELLAVSKCMGLKRGEQADILGKIRVKAVDRVPLFQLDGGAPASATREERYREARLECVREGFPDMDPPTFVRMFCEHMGCAPEDLVTRIEFEYLPSQLDCGNPLYAQQVADGSGH
ncbi:MAG TPA: hypothetical protein VFB71_02900 [Ramlibacter sp.]|nr:hypothetical protein [Ramlibacter sp.]